MTTIALPAVFLTLAAIALGAPPQVEISARFAGFDLSRYPQVIDANKADKPNATLAAPRVTTNSGQRATIEIVREVQVPEAPNGEKSVNSGITLDVTPAVKDGKITLSGKSIVRRRLIQDAAQPLGAISFTTCETFFNGAAEDGKELTIAVGDGVEDMARIILTVRFVEPTASNSK